MHSEQDEKIERDKIKFKQMLVAANPENAKDLIDAMDSDHADALSDEELDMAAAEGPRSAEEISEIMTDLRQLGFSFMDI